MKLPEISSLPIELIWIAYSAILVTLTGCSGMQGTYVAMVTASYESRDQPAAVTKLTETNLLALGYEQIGLITREWSPRKWAMENPGSSVTSDLPPVGLFDRSFEEAICEQAAAHGGELVLREPNRKSVRRDTAERTTIRSDGGWSEERLTANFTFVEIRYSVWRRNELK